MFQSRYQPDPNLDPQYSGSVGLEMLKPARVDQALFGISSLGSIVLRLVAELAGFWSGTSGPIELPCSAAQV